jgi:hypothetical protein
VPGNGFIVGLLINETFLRQAGIIRRKNRVLVPVLLPRSIAVDDPDQVPGAEAVRCFRNQRPSENGSHSSFDKISPIHACLPKPLRDAVCTTGKLLAADYTDYADSGRKFEISGLQSLKSA